MNQVEQYYEVIDYRSSPYFQVHHIIETHYGPILGVFGMRLYTFYAHAALPRRMNGVEVRQAQIDSRAIIDHLGIRDTALTDYNYLFEWCQLITIPNRDRREVNKVILLNPKHLVREYDDDLRYMGYIVPRSNQLLLSELRANVIEGCSPRPKKIGGLTKGKIEFEKTICARIDQWCSLDERLPSLASARIELVKPMLSRRAKPQVLLPGLVSDEANGNGHQPDEYSELIAELAEILGTETTAHELVTKYGAEVCSQQLDWWERRCEIAEASERGLDSAPGLLRRSIEGNWGEPEAPKPKAKSFIEEARELGIVLS